MSAAQNFVFLAQQTLKVVEQCPTNCIELFEPYIYCNTENNKQSLTVSNESDTFIEQVRM